MGPVRIYIMAGMVLLPSLVIAATDCQIVEYPDHYAAVCIGDEKSGAEHVQTPVATQAPAATKIPAATQTPEATQTPAATRIPAAVQTPVAGQVPLIAQANTLVTARADAAKVPVASEQHLSDNLARNTATSKGSGKNGKTIFLNRLRANLAQRSTPRN